MGGKFRASRYPTRRRSAIAEDDTWTTDPLALCLSGGGYRAAAFHLGTLHYFNRVGLLGNPGALSTISGGLLSLADGDPFDQFFARAYKQLLETDLIADSLRLLKEPPRRSARS